MWITEAIYAAYMESESLANRRGFSGFMGPMPRLTMSGHRIAHSGLHLLVAQFSNNAIYKAVSGLCM